uniref:Predicted protein n=1 Tax=Hordeum vulgare subsp. vulgare TaxID=112509 RepID=F2CZN1_HORVV|nr:predicted protein [Hordeum vulgare subsp. vulgare]
MDSLHLIASALFVLSGLRAHYCNKYSLRISM